LIGKLRPFSKREIDVFSRFRKEDMFY